MPPKIKPFQFGHKVSLIDNRWFRLDVTVNDPLDAISDDPLTEADYHLILRDAIHDACLGGVGTMNGFGRVDTRRFCKKQLRKYAKRPGTLNSEATIRALLTRPHTAPQCLPTNVDAPAGMKGKSMPTELKPCPFCGAEMKIIDQKPKGKPRAVIKIQDHGKAALYQEMIDRRDFFNQLRKRRDGEHG